MPANVTVTGRLAREVECKDAGNTRLCTLTVPTDDGFGERKTTTWWSCQVWGKAAERIESAIQTHGMYQKGDNVFITGSPKVRTYDKNDGSKGFSCEVNATTAEMIFAPKNESHSYGGGDSDSIPF